MRFTGEIYEVKKDSMFNPIESIIYRKGEEFVALFFIKIW